jgi:hypothetical protein
MASLAREMYYKTGYAFALAASSQKIRFNESSIPSAIYNG